MSSSNGADEHKIASSATDNADLENLNGQYIQIIANIQKIKQLYLSLIRNAQREVLLIFPTANAIRREEGVGVFAELLRASQHGVTIRILTPEDDFIRAQLDELRTAGINVKQIETPAEAKFKLLIVDKKFSLVIETRDDTRGTFEHAIGLATFSNSKPTVMPYVTIFESFWRETDLYDRARQADKIKDDFVNVAAHELRNPISPIMAGGDFAMEDVIKLKEGKVDQQTLDSLTDNINMIMRNASKLYKLSEDILQVSKIESGTFTLNIERVDLKLMLELAIQDARKRIENEKKPVDIRLDYKLNNNAKGKFALFCDNSKINQVLYNLIDNAIRYTDQGSLTVSAALYNPAELIVRVEDSGKGIDPEIKDKLFIKFASKSHGGTGLGLYLSKNIVNAHGGRIWAANNPSGVGATFSFILPTDLQPIALQKHNTAEMLEPSSSSNNVDKYVREGRETSVTEQ